MKLRTQIIFILLGVFVALAAASGIVQSLVTLPSYAHLERRLAHEDGDRCVAAIERELEALDKFGLEWSMWDDAYDWALNPVAGFIERNVTDEYFQQANAPVFLYCDAAGKVLYSSVRDPETGLPEHSEVFSRDSFAGDTMLFVNAEAPEFRGMLLTDRGPAIICSRPVVPTANNKPSAGRFIAARYLSGSGLDSLRAQVGIDFVLKPGEARSNADVVELPGGEELEVIKPLRTLNPANTLAIVATLPRSVMTEGRATVRRSALTMFGSAAAITLCLVVAMQCRVVNRVGRLHRHAASLARTGDLSSRVEVEGSDEIASLANEFNQMLSRLEESQRSMADLSRRAGMAEVASGVLHNVGNAMNSVVVSMGTIRTSLATSKVSSLQKAATLLASQPDPAAFITADPRGTQIPAFLTKVSDAIANEHAQLATEFDRLDHAVRHIGEIVREQQDVARAPDVAESVQLDRVIMGAADLVRPSFDRHSVTLTIGDLPDVRACFYRARLQQVLVNLLTNAGQAVRHLLPIQRQVSVSAELDGDRIVISVTDQGQGFAPEEREKFFRQGYTTRQDGHGVGLHYCAVTMSQLKGSIEAHSAGPGLGATFRITFPINREVRRSAA